MNRYLLLMHGDAVLEEDVDAWGPYLAALRRTGCFEGGSSIGGGIATRKSGAGGATTNLLVGYLLVNAETVEAARELLAGNPTYEAGGTVEIRELLVD
jgi:hypothetical protein